MTEQPLTVERVQELRASNTREDADYFYDNAQVIVEVLWDEVERYRAREANVATLLKDVRAELERQQAEIHKAEKRAELAKDMSETRQHQYWQERQNAILLYRTLAHHAPEALKEVQAKLYQSTNEYDKVESDMLRTIEHQQTELTRREAQLAWAVEGLQSFHQDAIAGRIEWLELATKRVMADIERMGKEAGDGDKSGT